MEATQDGLWDWDIINGRNHFNTRYYTMLGYMPGEFPATSDKWISLIHPDDKEKTVDINNDCIENRISSFRIEYRIKTKSGAWKWILGRGKAVSRDKNGRATRMVGTHTDISERKSSEEALRESEEKYRILFENAGEAVFIVQNDLIVFANHMTAELSCVPVNELIGRNLFDFSYEKDRELDKEFLFKLMNGETNKINRELRYQRGNGTVGWLNINAVKILWNGQPASLNFASDISEQKFIEDSLKKSEERYRFLIENMRDIIWQTDPHLNFTFINNYVEIITGYTPDELIGKPLFILLSDKSKDYVKDRSLVFKEKLLRGESVGHSTFEVEMISKEGLKKWVEINSNPVFNDQQELVEFYGVSRDITDRKLAEEALLDKSIELERYFTSALDLLCIADIDGKFKKLNPEWESALGYKIDELIGTKFFDYIHPEDLQLTIEAVNKLSSNKAVLNFTNRYKHKNGTYKWMEWRSYPEGNLIYAVARDITDRKSAEEDRIEMERRMLHVQKLESLGVLAGGMAHDFNNILMAVLGHAELALMDLPLMSPARDSLLEIENAARRAADLSRQMLAYSGRGKFVIEAIKLGELVSEMVHLLKASISKKALLNLNLEKEIPAIEGDATQIRQILMNLITNASDAIGDNSGVISVSTGVIECHRDYLSNTFLDDKLAEGLYVYLEVSDTGCGMDKATIDRIFEPFYTTKFTGRGLGMAAVLGIVRGHKGAINIYSEVNIGSTFKLLFPAVNITSENSKSESKLFNPIKEKKGAILLVDDEETIRYVGKRMLERLGFEVITAVDGIDACKQYEDNMSKIQLVLLDLTMPQRDGEETYREMRRLNSKVRVILTSGFTEQEITARFAGKGLAGFIQKPFSMSDLTEKIFEVINYYGPPS